MTFDISHNVFIVSYAVFLIFIGVSLLIKNNVKFKPTCALVFSLIVISSAVSVYESSVNTYLDISSTNAVVIYNNSAAIVVDADNISDYYKVKQCLSARKVKVFYLLIVIMTMKNYRHLQKRQRIFK